MTLTLLVVSLLAAPPVVDLDARFDNAEKVFLEVKRELRDHYVTDLTEEQLYQAAVQGMLAAVDPPRHEVNKLMTPSEFQDLTIEMKGEVTGIGVAFKFDAPTGRAEITALIKNSPAERAGLKVGDVILSVDNTSYKGKQMRDLVNAIRGKVQSKVSLAVLRDASILNLTIERERVTFDVVTHELQADGVGVLTIRSFNETTPAATRTALAALKGSKGLVIDLRDNEGGVLERSFDTLKLLLPKGKVMARLVSRGNKEEVRTNGDEPVVSGLPTVVLVNGQTRSSAELVAAALRDGLKAPLIGAKTFGKWSVQLLKELPNHFVMRYTFAFFKGPDGKSYENEGLPPDIEVGNEPNSSVDAQLKTAVSLLKLQSH